MSGKKRLGLLKEFLANEATVSRSEGNQTNLPYVETATRFGIIAEPYAAETRDRDIAWLKKRISASLPGNS